MNSIKRILSVFIAVALIVTASVTVAIPAAAADALPDGWEFQAMSDVKGICAANPSVAGRQFVHTDYGIAADGSFLVRSDVYSGMALSTTKQIPFTSANSVTTTVVIGNMVKDTATATGGLNESCADSGYGHAPVYGHSINLSADKSVLSGHGYASKVFYDNGISLKFFMSKTEGKIVVYPTLNGVSTSNKAPVSGVTFTPGEEVTFSFELSGNNVLVYYTKSGGSKTLLNTMTGAASVFADGKTYLSFAADSYGDDRTYDMTVKKVNGVAVSEFDGFYKENDGSDEDNNVSNVNTLTPSNADNSGTVVNNGKVFSFDYSKGNTPMAGTAMEDKVTVNGLTVAFKASKTSVANASYFGIFLSASKPTAFAPSVVGEKHGPNSDKSSTIGFTFSGSGAYLDVITACISELVMDNKILENSTCEIKFIKNDNGKYSVRLNNKPLVYNGSAVELDLSAVVDVNGQAYLTFAGMSTEAAGSKATVSKINGFDAVVFSEEADTGSRAGYIVGASFRKASGNTEQGLRFLIEVAKKKNGESVAIKEFGALIIPNDLVDDPSDLRLTESGKIVSSAKPQGVSYLKIVAEKFFAQTTDYVQFTAVLLGIPSDKLSRNFLVVGYITYADGTTVYTNSLSRSVNYVQRLASSSPATDVILPDIDESLGNNYIDMSTVLTAAASTSAASTSATANAAALNSLLSSLDATKEYAFYFKGGVYGLNGSVTFPANVTLIFDEDSSLYCGYGTTPVFNCKNIVSDNDHCILYLNPTSYGNNFVNMAFVRPEWFGAKVNDNTDDASAFNVAAHFGLPVLLSSGSYDIKTAVTVPYWFVLLGESEEKTSVINVAAGITAFTVRDDLGSGYCVHVENVKFKGASKSNNTALAFYGKHNAYSRFDTLNCEFEDLNKGIFYEFSGGCVSEGLIFNNVGTCIDVGQYSMFLYMRNCKAYDSGYFVYCDQPETNGVANGIQITNCETKRMTIASVYITRNQTTFVINCNFHSVSGNGIHFVNCYDSRIDNNVISSDGGGSYGIYLETSTGRETVTGNQVSGFSTGIALSKNPLVSSSASYLNNNLISNCMLGIKLTNLNDAKIIANAVEGCSTGISGTNNNGTMICQNRFNGAGTDKMIEHDAQILSGLVGANAYGVN